MKKLIFLSFALMFVAMISRAQTTAMQFSGQDCNGNNVNLFADLDSGKAVILHFYMPNCGSCPPPAKRIQAMANNINATHPGKVKGYAFPFQNTTTCTYSQTWVSSNSLSQLYAPMDSGEEQVAYYGGFGMPTVVVVGGPEHKVLYVSQNFTTSDTTEMRNKILAMLNGTGISDLPAAVNAFEVYPNPATSKFSVNIDLKQPTDVTVDVIDVTGKQVLALLSEKQSGLFSREFSTEALTSGLYFVRLKVGDQAATQKMIVRH